MRVRTTTVNIIEKIIVESVVFFGVISISLLLLSFESIIDILFKCLGW